jgi:phosphopantothenoylcysteine decarboxylase/phosphopantothenate--cysteine ligase
MTRFLKDKQVILGVSGGIAAYKAVELLRLLKKAGARVRVVMTANAQHFVGPMTFMALSEQPVCTSLFDSGDDVGIRHIDWAQSAHVMVVAPATANIIGKMAAGIADDALSTFLTATTAPVLLCPSMNTHMFQSSAVERNLKTLRADGVHIAAPDSGSLACGTTGPGRLPEPGHILDRIIHVLSPKDFSGKRILVTAGPTREPIDPVRFISNPSSGKMGYAIARAAEHRGAEVTLVSGPSALAAPAHMTVIAVQTAAEMADAVFDRMGAADIIIKTAAVSDYRPEAFVPQKIKKTSESLVLPLTKTQDILRELGQRKAGQILVGFAAETQNLAAHAEKKLVEKNLDIIVGNRVGLPDSGFGTDSNRVTLFFRDGTRQALEPMDKEDIAHVLLDRIGDVSRR